MLILSSVMGKSVAFVLLNLYLSIVGEAKYGNGPKTPLFRLFV